MSNDLAEIRRFWPKATWWGKNMHAAANGLRGLLWIERVKVGLHRVVYVPENWGRKDFDGPTIAAAMAAAGFAQRPIGRYRETFNQYADRVNGKAIKHRAWHNRKYRDKPVMLFADTCQRHDDGTVAWPVLLESRQRPRKKVRLGKRGRRLALAASMGEALDDTKHWRGK